MFLSKLKTHNFLISSLYVFIISFFVLFNFFAVGKYAKYPWWHSHGNDIDAAHAVTTVGLLNNSELVLIYHPSASIYTIQGTAFRVLSWFYPSYNRLFHLEQVSDMNQAVEVIDISTRAGRIITCMVSILFLILFYNILLFIIRNRLLAFLGAFYLASSGAFLIHSYWIRPEIFSLFFISAAVYVFLNFIHQDKISRKQYMIYSALMGFFTGLAVLSKVQIGTIIVFFVLFIIVLGVLKPYRDKINGNQKNISKFSFIVSSINLFIMPWWFLRRPEFLTQDFINRLHKYDHLRMVYGKAPDYFYLVVLGVLMILFIISLICLLRNKNSGGSFNILFLNGFVTGMIFSAYFILAPVSVSFSQYIDNSQHLIYSVFTNVTNMGFIGGEESHNRTWQRILNLHQQTSQIFYFNFFYFAAAAGFMGLIGMLRHKECRRSYAMVASFFIMGLMIDLVSNLRAHRPYIYSYYAIYSLPFYILSFFLWVKIQFGRSIFLNKDTIAMKAIFIMVNIFFVSYTMSAGIKLYRAPRATGISDQNPVYELRNVQAHGKPFCRIIDDSIQKNRKAGINDGLI